MLDSAVRNGKTLNIPTFKDAEAIQGESSSRPTPSPRRTTSCSPRPTRWPTPSTARSSKEDETGQEVEEKAPPLESSASGR
ncbi:MAG: hypothetical protein IPJ34_02990 [Myxococcales bacterium]|nr:hypothetical protein [Myxococcales bacterium]